MSRFLSGKSTSTMNGNGRAGGVHAGRPALGADILRGGHGKTFLEDKRRMADQELAEKKRSVQEALPDLQSLAEWQSDDDLSVIASVRARMDRMGHGAASKIEQWFGRQSKTFTAFLRELCQVKGLFRPVAKAEPVVNTFALFLVFFCIETAANSSIFYGLGRFPSVHGAVIFSGTIALINLGIAWAFGFLALRNWNHSSEKVRGWARRSLIPLALGWLALHGGAVFLRLSENLDFQNLQFSDLELMDVFSSGMLVLIALLTTVICTFKAYKRCGDVDAEYGDTHKRCEEPQAAAESEADAAQDALDEWMEEARAQLKALGAQVEQNEAALHKGKAAWEQGNRDLAALAEHLKKDFSVAIAEASTKDKFTWSQGGPSHRGLEFSPQATRLDWDQAAEVRARGSLTRARERLTQARQEVETSYAEASDRIQAAMNGLYKITHFQPEETT